MSKLFILNNEYLNFTKILRECVCSDFFYFKIKFTLFIFRNFLKSSNQIQKPFMAGIDLNYYYLNIITLSLCKYQFMYVLQTLTYLFQMCLFAFLYNLTTQLDFTHKCALIPVLFTAFFFLLLRFPFFSFNKIIK